MYIFGLAGSPRIKYASLLISQPTNPDDNPFSISLDILAGKQVTPVKLDKGEIHGITEDGQNRSGFPGLGEA
jgi:hypothetical protein